MCRASSTVGLAWCASFMHLRNACRRLRLLPPEFSSSSTASSLTSAAVSQHRSTRPSASPRPNNLCPVNPNRYPLPVSQPTTPSPEPRNFRSARLVNRALLDRASVRAAAADVSKAVPAGRLAAGRSKISSASGLGVGWLLTGDRVAIRIGLGKDCSAAATDGECSDAGNRGQ